jgi:MFS family permease
LKSDQNEKLVKKTSANSTEEETETETKEEGYDEPYYKKTLIAILLALLIGNMMNNNVVSFLPAYIKAKNWSNSESFNLEDKDTAIILAMFSVAQIIFAPINSFIKNKLGKKNTIVVGFVILTVTTTGLGAIGNLTNSYAFLFTACILRFF